MKLYVHFFETESLRRPSAGKAAMDSRRPRPNRACGTRDMVTTECLEQGKISFSAGNSELLLQMQFSALYGGLTFDHLVVVLLGTMLRGKPPHAPL